MPDPTNHNSPAPDAPDPGEQHPSDFFSADELLSHRGPEAEAALLPVFESYCASLGQERTLTLADIALQEQFRGAVLGFLGEGQRASSLFRARQLAAAGIAGWDGRETLALCEELLVAETGHSVVPLEVLRPDNVGLELAPFWKSDSEERFSAPVGIIAKIVSGDLLTEIEPVFSPAARTEAGQHAKVIASHLNSVQARSTSRRYFVELGAGSVQLAVMFHAIQLSHERFDCDIPVWLLDSGQRMPHTTPALSPIVGVSKLVLETGSNCHEVGVVAIDPRVSPRGDVVPEGEQILRQPLIEKTYSVKLEAAGPFVPVATPLEVRISAFRVAV